MQTLPCTAGKAQRISPALPSGTCAGCRPATPERTVFSAHTLTLQGLGKTRDRTARSTSSTATREKTAPRAGKALRAFTNRKISRLLRPCLSFRGSPYLRKRPGKNRAFTHNGLLKDKTNSTCAVRSPCRYTSDGIHSCRSAASGRRCAR